MESRVVTPEVGVGLVRVLDAVSSATAAQVFSAAIALDVFGELADAPLTPAELEKRAGLHPRALTDFLDALTAMGLLVRTRAGEYRATAATGRHLSRGSSRYIGRFVAGEEPQALVHLLRHGTVPFDPEAGDPFADPAVAGEFIAFMDAMNSMISHELVEALDWESYSSFVDVDGASGSLGRALIAEHPHLTGTVVDRPEVEPVFAAAQEAAPTIAPRLTFRPVTDGLPEADVFLLGGVLHDKSLDERKELLGAVRDRLRPGGLVLVYDIMIDDGRTALAPLLGSIQMMMTVPDGGKYTEAECRDWIEAAGLSIVGVQPMGVDTLVVAGYPVG